MVNIDTLGRQIVADPQQGLAAVLDEAKRFARQQQHEGIACDLTLSDTYYFDEEELDIWEYGNQPFQPVVDAGRAEGWILRSADPALTVNRLSVGHGLVLLRNGEIGTHFTGKFDPDTRRNFGSTAIRGDRIYDVHNGNARARRLEMARRYRLHPAELPQGQAAGLLANQILLGIYQRQNFQRRAAA